MRNMTNAASPAAQLVLGAVLVLGLCTMPLGCTDDTPETTSPAPAPEIRPGAPVGTDDGGKPPFDVSRLPVAIDVVHEVVAPTPPPLQERPLPLGDAYAAAFRELPGGTTFRGFEVASFLLPNGMRQLRFEVNRQGEAAWFLTVEAEQPTHVARVQRFGSPEQARVALRQALSGYQQRLQTYELGDLGFAAYREGQPFRILFVRGNLLLQAWSLAGGLADVLALALDTHARSAPVDDGSAAPALELEVNQPIQAGANSEVGLSYAGDAVATHYMASGNAWVDTQSEQAWLLAPKPGEVLLSAVVFDGWLRGSKAQLAVLVHN